MHYPILNHLISRIYLVLVLSPAETTTLLFSIIILFFISFLVAGSEVAFFSLTVKDINMLKTRQQPSYKRIVSLLENPRPLMASMLIATSVVNIGIILIANVLMNNWINDLHMALALQFIIKILVVSILLILFCEMLPKVWATHHKIWFASTASLIIELFYTIFFRLSSRLVSMGYSVEKSFGSGSPGLDDKQLDYAIDLLPDNEATSEEKQILKGIRKFGNTTVKQTMRTRLDVSGVDINTTFSELKSKVEEMHYSRFPVYRNNLDDIAGILHTKDLLPFLNEEEYEWRSLMRQVFYIHEQKQIEDLLQDFRNKRMHLAVVVDEFGGTSGIITLEDIMEEIIGDIQDEFDDEQSANKKIDDFNYIFEGRTMINDVCKALHIPLDTFNKIRGDSDSLAGLLLEIAGGFPEINASIVAGDFTFIPLTINKNRIEKIKLVLNRREDEKND